jgi:hypothetical protein
VLVALAVLGYSGSAQADAIAPPPVRERFAVSDLVLVGRVTAIEEKDVEAPLTPSSPNKVKYRIAVVSVLDGAKLPKAMKTIRVGVSAGAGRGGVRLGVGSEGLFYLTRHFQGGFFAAPMYFQVIDKQHPWYAKELEQVKRYAKLLDKPLASLESKNKDDRLLMAALLLAQYRTPKGGKSTQLVPIDANESKLILTALWEADWNRRESRPLDETPAPLNLFMQLGVGAKDGFSPPKGAALMDLQKAAQAWLQVHKDSYRILRHVAASK